MSLEILNDVSGARINVDLDAAELTGTIDEVRAGAYIQGLVAGACVGVDSDGYLQLASGDTTDNILPLGLLVLDAASTYADSLPALGAQKMAVLGGPALVESNNIESGITFAPGDSVYCSDTVGKLTNVAPSNSFGRIGVALSSASASAPELTFKLTV